MDPIEYINNLGLSHLEWHPNTDDVNCNFCLGIVSRDGRLSLEVIIPSGKSDDENTWMSADDLCS